MLDFLLEELRSTCNYGLVMDLSFCKIVEEEKDFILIDNRDQSITELLDGDLVSVICHRVQGVGASAIITVERGVAEGSLCCKVYGAALSAEALACFALFVSALGEDELVSRFSFESDWGDIAVQCTEDGEVKLSSDDMRFLAVGRDVFCPEFIYSGVLGL